MGILGTAVPGAGGGAYTIDNSLRTRSSASGYLNRTPSSNGNRKTWTYSAWVKRGDIASNQKILSASSGTNNAFDIGFGSTNKLSWEYWDGANNYYQTSTQVFRDPSAWYHFVIAVDTTQATDSNRVKVYVNGTQITAWDSTVYPANNLDTQFNSTSFENRIARGGQYNTQYFDAYQTEVRFIDGQQLTPSSFGETNASTGVWQPKAYTGTYGTNGFYLKFSDIATTSGSNAGLGKDFSGNGNYYNTNNISVTSGITYDAMLDSPTLKSATVGNFCVWNPTLGNTYGPGPNQKAPLSNANLRVTDAAGTYNSGATGTIGASSGKFYWEYTLGSTAPQYNGTGITFNGSFDCNQDGLSYDPYASGGCIRRNGSTILQSSLGSASANDVIGIALDCDSQTVKWYKNNVQVGTTVTYTSYLPSGSTSVWPSWWTANTIGSFCDVNFGQRPFAYTPPSGYIRLQTYNLTTPTIGASSTTLANKYFDATTYSGSASTPIAVTNAGSFQPGLLWVKRIDQAEGSSVQNIVDGSQKHMTSNATSGEYTETGGAGIVSFNSNGFSVGTQNVGPGGVNAGAGSSYVGWQWKANGTGSTNTAGSTTSTVSANTTNGFSIVNYTGTGSNATIGHGLGIAPSVIIVKSRTTTLGRSWNVYHQSLGNTKAIYLNLTNGADTNSIFWNNTSPTSTVFTVGSAGDMNANGEGFLAYCFAEIAGFSKLSAYTGNGSSDGPFVYCGFRPKYIMWKRSNASGDNWWILDSTRSPYNVAQDVLLASSANAQSTQTTPVDFLSNGFKLRNGTDGSINASGSTYIYMAFAESPFNYSLAR